MSVHPNSPALYYSSDERHAMREALQQIILPEGTYFTFDLSGKAEKHLNTDSPFLIKHSDLNLAKHAQPILRNFILEWHFIPGMDSVPEIATLSKQLNQKLASSVLEALYNDPAKSELKEIWIKYNPYLKGKLQADLPALKEYGMLDSAQEIYRVLISAIFEHEETYPELEAVFNSLSSKAFKEKALENSKVLPKLVNNCHKHLKDLMTHHKSGGLDSAESKPDPQSHLIEAALDYLPKEMEILLYLNDDLKSQASKSNKLFLTAKNNLAGILLDKPDRFQHLREDAAGICSAFGEMIIATYGGDAALTQASNYGKISTSIEEVAHYFDNHVLPDSDGDEEPIGARYLKKASIAHIINSAKKIVHAPDFEQSQKPLYAQLYTEYAQLVLHKGYANIKAAILAEDESENHFVGLEGAATEILAKTIRVISNHYPREEAMRVVGSIHPKIAEAVEGYYAALDTRLEQLRAEKGPLIPYLVKQGMLSEDAARDYNSRFQNRLKDEGAKKAFPKSGRSA
jgi:hypothetical protein